MSQEDKKYIGIVAGEASGDFLGASLISEMKRHRPSLHFAGIGGPAMQAQGFESWYPMEHLSVRGYVEVLRQLPGLLAMRNRVKGRLLQQRPELFIGIDAPDFNLTLEKSLKNRGVKTIHYVSPSVWAWRAGRIRQIGAAASHVLTLFPFEQEIYRRAGIPATYVGHPLADLISEGDVTKPAREQLRLSSDKTIIALLPGSRQSELHYMASLFIQAARIMHRHLPEAQFLVPMISRETRELFESAIYRERAQDLPLKLLFGHSRSAIAASDAVLVASGTATLEVGLCRKPMVITYRMSPTTWSLMSKLRYQPWVGLPNIIAGCFLVPEILQDDATPENLANAMINVLGDPVVRERLPAKLCSMHSLLRMGGGKRAAEAIMECMK